MTDPHPLKKRGRKKKVVTLQSGSQNGSVSFCLGGAHPQPPAEAPVDDGVTVQFGKLNIQVAANTREVEHAPVTSAGASTEPVSLPGYFPAQGRNVEGRALTHGGSLVHSAHCWNCTLPIDLTELVPKVLPVKYNFVSKSYKFEGRFCSWSCVKRYNGDRRDAGVSARSHLLLMLLKDVYGRVKTLPTAPKRVELAQFGGQITNAEMASLIYDPRDKEPPRAFCEFKGDNLRVINISKGGVDLRA